MKTRVVILLVITLSVFSSCTKEDAEQIECEGENIGYLTITNTSENPYKIYIDGTLTFTLDGNTFIDDHKISVGVHKLKAEQESGFLFYPTIVEETFSFGQCEKLGWVIP